MTSPADKLGRNDPCHCQSGKKYKKCHLDQDEAAARELRAKMQPAPHLHSAACSHGHGHEH